MKRRKQDIIDKHNEAYQKEIEDIEREQREAEEKIDADARDRKADKLAEHMEKLRDAQKGNFGDELDAFQKEQGQLEAEIERQRQRERDDLERRLKNRRNKAKSKKELAIKEEVDDLVQKDKDELDQLKQKADQIKAVIAADASTGTDPVTGRPETGATSRRGAAADAAAGEDARPEIDIGIPAEAEAAIAAELAKQRANADALRERRR